MIVASLIPRVSTTLAHSKVNRAAYVIAADLMLSPTLAARQHAPVSVQVWPDSMFLRITDVLTGKVLRTERFDKSTEFQLSALSATPAAAQVMPNGTATATIVVTVGGTDYSHQVRMTQAGQVRITR